MKLNFALIFLLLVFVDPSKSCDACGIDNCDCNCGPGYRTVCFGSNQGGCSRGPGNLGAGVGGLLAGLVSAKLQLLNGLLGQRPGPAPCQHSVPMMLPHSVPTMFQNSVPAPVIIQYQLPTPPPSPPKPEPKPEPPKPKPAPPHPSETIEVLKALKELGFQLVPQSRVPEPEPEPVSFLSILFLMYCWTIVVSRN